MKSRSADRSGQTAILFTLALVPLFGMLGLAVDIGWAHFRKEAAQTAADAAAVAAALAAYQAAAGGPMSCTTTGIACYANETSCPSTITSPPSNNIQAGCMYARDNGFVTTGRQKVTFQSGVGSAPTSAGVTTSYWVVARVSENVPQLFSSVLGFPTAAITARATTGANEASSGGCVITLDPNASGALTMTGSTSLTSGCGVFVNSNALDAITLNGGGTITTTGSAKTEIVGNCNGCGNIHPSAQTGRPYMGDPMADLEAPSVGSCSTTNLNLGSHQTQTISAGVYCGGITLGAQSELTLNPGLYIVKTGSVSLGAQTHMTGSGVTFYLVEGGVTMSGGATVDISAPSSGGWQGILFFQARGNATASTLVGGTSQSMNGALYFPSAALTYTGGSSTSATATTIISRTLSLVGNSYISAAANTTFTGNQGGVSLIQ